MSTVFRAFTGTTQSARRETFNGTEYLVVPVVALVEGVITAANAKGPELVLASEFGRAPASWNGRPATAGHPFDGTNFVSAGDPKILEQYGLGMIFNSAVQNKELHVEGWINEAAALAAGGDKADVVNRVNAGETLEVSVGAMLRLDDTTGQLDGVDYVGAWRDVLPDHIAFLKASEKGACSVAMGCGAQRAAAAEGSPVPQRTLRERLRAILPSLRVAAGDSTAEELAEMVGYEAMLIMAQTTSTALKGLTALINELIAAEQTEATGADETAEETIEDAKLQAIAAFCSNVQGSISGVWSMAIDLLYADYSNEGDYYLKAKEVKAAAGARHSANDQQMIQTMHDASVSLGAACAPIEAATERSACGCQSHQGEETMKTKAERIAALIALNSAFNIKSLESMTDEQIDMLEKVTKPVETPAAPVVEPPVAAASAPKVVSMADYLASVPAELRDSVNEGLRMAGDKKATLVKALIDTGRCPFTEVQLKAKGLDELESLSKLAAVDTVTNFGALGGEGVLRQRAAGEKDESVAANPPDPYAAGLAALAAKR